MGKDRKKRKELRKGHEPRQLLNHNKVLAELVAGQRQIVARRGGVIPHSDQELGQIVLDRFGVCPWCGDPIEFVPRIAIEYCEGREHFVSLYGAAMQKHHKSHPECDARGQAFVQEQGWDYVRAMRQDRRRPPTLDDLRRWGLR
jgi:hypothetical protein